jgi:biopolymer transport protein ExbD
MRHLNLRLAASLLAAAFPPYGYAQTQQRPSPIEIELGVDSDDRCFVASEPIRCEDVGAYLRDSLRLPGTAHLHVSVDRRARYERVEKLLESIRDAGYRNLGFVGDVRPGPGST